jgi:hypothetical protein
MCMHELIMYKSTCMHYVCLRGNHKRLANMYVEKGFMRTSFKFAHQNQEFKVRGGRAGRLEWRCLRDRASPVNRLT